MKLFRSLTRYHFIVALLGVVPVLAALADNSWRFGCGVAAVLFVFCSLILYMSDERNTPNSNGP